MRKFLLTLGAAASLATGMVATTAGTASADPFYGRGYYGGGYFGGHRGYYRGYRHHRGNGDALAAGAIGLGVGAILGSAIASQPYSGGRYYGRGYYGNGYDGGGYYGRPDGVVVEGPVYQERRVYYRPAPVYREVRPARAYGYSHADACAARYRTYDYQTDTYIASPGVVRRCRL
jgi:hypothetical protein